MGLQNRTSGNYITILDGKLCQKVEEGTEGAVTRLNKMGREVHEKFYDSFTGKLVDIKTEEGAYGKDWKFSFRDKGEVYVLQLGYTSGYAIALLKQLPNLDLTQEATYSPSSKEIDGKRRSTMFINQNGVVLKHAYTKDNPNGLPQWEQITVRGQVTYDNTKQMEFLENMVNTDILPKLKTSMDMDDVDTAITDEDLPNDF